MEGTNQEVRDKTIAHDTIGPTLRNLSTVIEQRQESFLYILQV